MTDTYTLTLAVAGAVSITIQLMRLILWLDTPRKNRKEN